MTTLSTTPPKTQSEQATRLVGVARSRIPANPACVAAVRDHYIAFLLSLGIDEREKQAWMLVFTEVVMNAIVHGAGRDPEKGVVIEWWCDAGEVCLSVTDPGPGPRAARIATNSLPDDPNAESGRGFFILNQFADRLDHQRGPSGFTLQVTKAYDFLNDVLPPNDELEQVLDELSTCYENLSAFYRLSQSLLHADEAADFIRQALDDFLMLHPFDRMTMVGAPDLADVLLSQLGTQEWFTPADKLSPALLAALVKSPELVWDTPGDLAEYEIPTESFPDMHHGCVIPMSAGDAAYGWLVALRREAESPVLSHTLGSLRTLADLFGIACANSHLRQQRSDSQKSVRDLEIAVEIQKQLLPILPTPQSDVWDVRIYQESSLGVAGDYAVATLDANEDLVVTLIDVMGKGVSAALVASIFRTAFELVKDVRPVDELLSTVNRALCNQLGSMTMFVTCAVLRIDKQGKWMEHANAGHCHTLAYAPDGTLTELEPSGPPIGLVPHMTYTSDRLDLVGGERFILVSDGCYEFDVDGELYGWERLVELLDPAFAEDPDTGWDELLRVVREHTGDQPLADDCTLVSISLPARDA